jgi:uncharacterized protein (TIGR02284 family)
MGGCSQRRIAGLIMTNDILDHLKSLHTCAIDARNGYQEALKQADGKGMTPLFREMMELHERNAAELARALARDNEVADEEGSFMTVVHQTIMDVRSMFDGLEESVLPGLIEGEKRNVSKYHDAILSARTRPIIANFLATQRDGIVGKNCCDGGTEGRERA